MQYIFFILAFLCGAIYPIQGSFNGRRLTHVGSPIITAIISFLAGLLGLIVLAFAYGVKWQQLLLVKNAPWYAWTGGLLGAFYVATVVIVLPRLGMVLTFSLIVAGQLVLSIIMDHFGLLGNTIRELSLGRMAGIILLVIGIVLIRKY